MKGENYYRESRRLDVEGVDTEALIASLKVEGVDTEALIIRLEVEASYRRSKTLCLNRTGGYKYLTISAGLTMLQAYNIFQLSA